MIAPVTISTSSSIAQHIFSYVWGIRKILRIVPIGGCLVSKLPPVPILKLTA